MSAFQRVYPYLNRNNKYKKKITVNNILTQMMLQGIPQIGVPNQYFFYQTFSDRAKTLYSFLFFEEAL